MSTPLKHITDDLLVKYLLQETNEIENQQVLSWIKANKENEKYFKHFQQIWEQSKILEKTKQVDTDAAWMRFKERRLNATTTKKSTLTNNTWLKIAAALLIIVTIGWLFKSLWIKKDAPPNYEMLSIVTQKSILVDTLPDASIVTLNKNAQLSYPSAFAGNERRVSLQGEAFFQISPNKEKPFIIAVNDVLVKVVGTSFNIKSINGSTEVIVETGIVQVIKNKEVLQLQANEKVILTPKANKLQKEMVTDKLYKYYRTKTFVCDNTPLEKLVDILNEAYGVTIIIENKELHKLPLTTTFQDASLETILNIVEETFSIKATKKGDTIILK